jgi:hypothetical protein
MFCYFISGICHIRSIGRTQVTPIESSYPNVEVVAPISAPILQIVPFPVQDIEVAPSPKYSTIAPVPPLTVRIPATLRITSLEIPT